MSISSKRPKKKVGKAALLEPVSPLESLRMRGLQADGFFEGYVARDAIVHAGEMIRSMRESIGITQADLAKRAGMSQPEVSRLEAGLGKTGPGVETLNRLAKACDMRLMMGVRPISSSQGKAGASAVKHLADI